MTPVISRSFYNCYMFFWCLEGAVDGAFVVPIANVATIVNVLHVLCFLIELLNLLE